jgi:hypothetical protein
MAEILLVEPAYRSKFPPLGLMRISTYHKDKGDMVVFVKGKDPEMKARCWNRIYISSLFTWELPKTFQTLRYYSSCVDSHTHLIVGGVGATLLPEYLRSRIKCSIVSGLLTKPNMLGRGSRVVGNLPPDYDILHAVDYSYSPIDAYFVRVTQGCSRSCQYCAVPMLEPTFGYLRGVESQINDTKTRFGEKHDLLVLDNNILAIPNVEEVIAAIKDCGFHSSSKMNGRKRTVDFNQGIDARIIAARPHLAKSLATICLSPVRLAFDYMGIEGSYKKAVRSLVDSGFREFTNYMLFNYNDTPVDLYRRMMANARLNQEYGIRITGFPMRFLPMDRVDRGYVSKGWKWRHLRGIQCVLLATRGLISPNPEFIEAAFGRTYEDFLEILSMPDRYIIHRERYRNNGAASWRRLFRNLSESEKNEFYNILENINRSKSKAKDVSAQPRRYRRLLEHYYPSGKIAE